jgi:hypothetical protein
MFVGLSHLTNDNDSLRYSLDPCFSTLNTPKGGVGDFKSHSYQHHTRIPEKHIYVYAFGLRPVFFGSKSTGVLDNLITDNTFKTSASLNLNLFNQFNNFNKLKVLSTC